MFTSKYSRVLITLFLLLSLPLGILLVSQKTNFFNRAFGVSANIFVDVSISEGIQGQSWKNFSQGGEEKGNMFTSVTGKISTLKPEYIRIDHIYDNYDLVQKDGSGNLILNWTNLDATVASIRATGALPFLSLSYMPPSIAKNSAVDEEPVNWNDWENLVQQTVEHFSGRKGLNLNNIYYEVWNEPDLFGKFTINGEKNYLTLYQHAASGAGRAGNVNSFKFGGPATTDLYKNWFDSLLQFCQKNNVRLDFFSWHKYSNDLGEYEDEVKNVKSWVSAFPSFANLEFDVTENGIDPKNDPAYDGGLSAIQTIASTAVLQGTVRRSFLFELKDGPGEAQYWGRWGILTNQKYGDPAAKPRFNAVLFLNNMIGDNLLVAGQGTWVKAFAKKDESGKVRVLVVNFDPVGSHQEAVPIRISKLTNGEYTVKRIDFGGGIRTRPTTVASNVIDITETFNANTTAIIEISHQ